MNRERNGKVLCWTLACCVATSPLTGEPKNSKILPPADAKQQVLNLEREWVDAEIKHDAATLRRILDDKFLASFGPNKPYDKEIFIKHITSGDVDPTIRQSSLAPTLRVGQRAAQHTRWYTDIR